MPAHEAGGAARGARAAGRPGCATRGPNALVAAAVGRPRSRRDDDGALRVGGVDVRDLARDFGTPAYVLDEVDFRAACRRPSATAFDGNADVYYAGKAFLCTAVARWMVEDGSGARHMQRR